MSSSSTIGRRTWTFKPARLTNCTTMPLPMENIAKEELMEGCSSEACPIIDYPTTVSNTAKILHATEEMSKQLDLNHSKALSTESGSRVEAVMRTEPTKMEVHPYKRSEFSEDRLSLSASPSLSIESYNSSDNGQQPKKLPQARKYELNPPDVKALPTYRKRRDLNNEAVRKSRTKAKERQEARDKMYELLMSKHNEIVRENEVIQQKNLALLRENEKLKKKLEKYEKSVSMA